MLSSLMLHCIALCCVLHCVALCCTVLHCAAVRCSVLQRVAAHLGALAGGGMLIQFGVLLQEWSAVHVLEWRRRRQFTLFIYLFVCLFDYLCVFIYASIHLFIYVHIQCHFPLSFPAKEHFIISALERRRHHQSALCT